MALLNDREAQEWIERANTAEAEVKRLRECIDKCRKSAELEASPDGPSGDVTNLLHRGDLALRDYGDLADGIEAREDELVRLNSEVIDNHAELVRLRALFHEIGGYGGPLYLLSPSQGERPDEIAARDELQRIVTEALKPETEAKRRTEVQRLLHVMAAALERTQVGDCGEATMILEAEVKLDGSPADKDNNDADTG